MSIVVALVLANPSTSISTPGATSLPTEKGSHPNVCTYVCVYAILYPSLVVPETDDNSSITTIILAVVIPVLFIILIVVIILILLCLMHWHRSQIDSQKQSSLRLELKGDEQNDFHEMPGRCVTTYYDVTC